MLLWFMSVRSDRVKFPICWSRGLGWETQWAKSGLYVDGW